MLSLQGMHVYASGRPQVPMLVDVYPVIIVKGWLLERM